MIKRHMALLMATVISLVGISPMAAVESSYAADKTKTDAEFEKYLDEQGFSESYKEPMRELHKLHPNWTFQAYHTNLEWEEVVEAEMLQTRNLIPELSYIETSFYDTELSGSFNYLENKWKVFSDPNWLQVSREGLEYYLDPRNWIVEDRVFMFELLSYNRKTQTLQGVEKILEGTFMENTYLDGGAPNPYLSSQVYSINDSNISNVGEKVKVSELLSNINGLDSSYLVYVMGQNGIIKNDDAYVGTGDNVAIYVMGDVDTVFIAEYPVIIMGDINGDGVVDPIDRSYLRGYISGSIVLSANRLKAADADQNNRIDVEDEVLLKDHIRGKSKLEQKINGSSLTYAQAFMQIGKELGVSPYTLAFRVRLEQGGQGTSAQISGKVPGFEGYYNYFNINASGMTREEITQNAMVEAVAEGWNSRYAALAGGAKKLANGHIWKGQDTLYLQKFDVEADNYGLYWHQYMQNVLAPYMEGYSAYSTYESMDMVGSAFVFKIPVYLNMPEEASAKPSRDGNPNNRLASLKIEGYEIDFSYDKFTYEITLPKKKKKLKVSAVPISEKATVSGTGTITVAADAKNIKIVVKAENGLKQTYTVKIKRS